MKAVLSVLLVGLFLESGQACKPPPSPPPIIIAPPQPSCSQQPIYISPQIHIPGKGVIGGGLGGRFGPYGPGFGGPGFGGPGYGGPGFGGGNCY